MKTTKIVIASLFSLLLLGFSFPVTANESGKSNKLQKTTEDTSINQWGQEDEKKLKEQLGLLRSALGKQTPKTEYEEKSAEVADKAFALLKKLITSVASQLEKVLPEVLRIMIKQQYAKAIGDLVVPWFLLLLVWTLAIIAKLLFWKNPIPKKSRTERQLAKAAGEKEDAHANWYHDTNWGNLNPAAARLLVTTIIPCIISFIVVWVGLCALSDSIRYIINPEYYALEDLIKIILSKGKSL